MSKGDKRRGNREAKKPQKTQEKVLATQKRNYAMFDYVEENFDYDEAVAAAKSRSRVRWSEPTQPEPIENYCATLAKRHAALTAMAAGWKAKTSWTTRWFSKDPDQG